MSSLFYDSLIARKNYLTSIINKKTKSLCNVRKGSLRVSGSKDHPQYYLITETKENEYINAANIGVAAALSQKNYDQRIIAAADKELVLLNRLIRLGGTYVEEIYETLSPARRALVTPIRLPDDEYIAKWLESKRCVPMGFDENDPVIMTMEGYRVRSKSEQLWADSFERLGVPHVFEPKLYLKEHGWVRPDFVGLNVRKRKEIWVEHLGMMDDIAYSNKNVSKVRDYERNGYILGDNFLITLETRRNPPEAKAIEDLIKKHFL